MSPTRKLMLGAILIAAVTVTTAAMLGVASGEGPAGSATVRTVSVEGVGTAPIGPSDTAAQATIVYREGIAKALADGQAKAAFLAEKSGVALGAVINIYEDGGGIECTGTVEGERYAAYEGEQPDFGYGRTTTTVAAPESGAARGVAAPTVSHRPVSKRKRRKAHKAVAARCNLTANVSAVYALG